MRYDLEIRSYPAVTEQEIADRAEMLRLAGVYGDAILTRASDTAHMTGSGFIVDPAGNKTLMVFHNIYRSWSWTGGHADGQEDLLEVALREAREETGAEVRPLWPEPVALDIIPVYSHFKRGAYVRAHMHLNLTYALVAREDAPLAVKPDENSAVAWIGEDEMREMVSEPPMLEVYEKIWQRIRAGMEARGLR